MSSAKRFLPQGFCPNLSPTCTPHHGRAKDHELLWQTSRLDSKCTSGGRFAAATVMTTTFIPTRSGDGTFVLDFGPCQYTLFSRGSSGYLGAPFCAKSRPDSRCFAEI